jgi:spermidine synthase/MFS family permease
MGSHTSRDRRGAVALAIAVFLSGAVLLGLEITASRVLAPAFGSSIFVWGALIGVVLTGLAAGYWAGGALADRIPNPYLLVATLSLGAGLVLLIPYADSVVIDLVVDWDIGPRADPLLAAALLFGPMSVVLAAATPIAVRLAARSLERLGTTAGRLFAISTVGSIFGTFVTAFWLVPELGTDQVIASGSVALLLAAAVVAIANGQRAAALTAAIAAGGAALVMVSLAPQQGGTLSAADVQNYSPLYRQREEREPRKLDPADVAELATGFTIRDARETRYHRLLVVDDDDSRFLRFDSSFQSGMYLDDPFRTRFLYTDYLDLGIAYNPNTSRMLFIGLGGGSAPKRVWRDFPAFTLHAVELDPDVVETARRWFELPRDDRLGVTVEDGRRYLRKEEQTWDVIVIDAFFSDSIPFHLTTQEFVELARTRLRPGGVVVVNLIGALTGDSSKLLRSVAKTYSSVFRTVQLHPVYEDEFDRDADSIRNVILVATDRDDPGTAELTRTWNRIRETASTAPDLDAAIADRWPEPLDGDGVPVLTDGYAPTDSLLLD